MSVACRIPVAFATVTGMARLELLFLDVDGPLVPFGAEPGTYPVHATGLDSRDTAANPLLYRVDPAHGGRLAALGCRIVWATTWEDDANDLIAPLIGLPRLPVVHWPPPSTTPPPDAATAPDDGDRDGDGGDEPGGLHWKTRALVAWAAGRPFVWIDDEITEADRAWVGAHHPAPALLHRVDARTGLTDADYAAVGAWLRMRDDARGERRPGRPGRNGDS